MDMPLIVMTGFAKNEMENISDAAKVYYKKAVAVLVKEYKG